MRRKYCTAWRFASIVGLLSGLAATEHLSAQFATEWATFDGTQNTIFAVPAGSIPFWSVDGACSGALNFRDGTRGDNGSLCLRTLLPVGIGTRMIRDLNPGPGSSTFGGMTVNGYDVLWRLWVSADGDTNSGHELYGVLNPLYPVMTLEADINPGTAGSTPMSLFEDTPTRRTYFSADDGTHGRELWLGSVNINLIRKTELLADINPGPGGSNPGGFATTGSVIVFAADDGTNGRELWKTDGTGANTELLMDINVTAAGASSDPESLVPSTNNFVFFSADDGIHGRELWRTNGTLAGTGLCKDIAAGAAGSNPARLTAAQFVVNLAPTPVLAFTADSDGANGSELWTSRGALDGSDTAQLFDPGAAGSPENLTAVRGLNLLFFTLGNDLWKSDGTTEGTVLVQSFVAPPTSLLAVGSAGGTLLYFAADDGTGQGTELWRADAFGAVLVKDVNPGAGSSSPANLLAVGGRVYFSADDGTHGRELWRTDSAEGAVLVKDIKPGPSGSDPANLTGFDGTLVFSADDGQHGRELWQSDGNAEPPHSGWSYKWDLASLIQQRSGNTEMVAVAGTDGNTFSVYWMHDFPAMGGPGDGAISDGAHQVNTYVEITDGSDRAPLNLTYVDCGDGSLPRPKAALTDGTTHNAIAFGMVAVLDQDPCDTDPRGGGSPGVPFAHVPAVFDGREWIPLTLEAFTPGVPTAPPTGVQRIMGESTSNAYLATGGLPAGLSPATEPPSATRRFAWGRIDVSTDHITVLWGKRQGLGTAPRTWVATLPRQYLGSFKALYAGNSACLQSPYPFYFDSVVLNNGIFTDRLDPFGACCSQEGCAEAANAAACPGKFSPWTACDEPDFRCCPLAWADSDRDGDIDATDFAMFQRCYTGESSALAPECACLDSDQNGVIDEEDLEAFIQCANGPGWALDPVPAECIGL